MSGLLNNQPVGVAEAVRLVLGGLVALGWVALDEPAVMTVSTAVAALVSVGLTVWSWWKVTPTAKLFSPGE